MTTELSSIKKKLLEKLLAKTESAEQYSPLSPIQKRLYTLQKMEETSTAYNLPVTIEIKGPLDIAKMEEAFKKLIARHESLRTDFQEIDGSLMQRVHKAVDFHIEVIEGNKGENIQPFNLSSAPLIKVKITHFSALHHLLFLDIHHIIADGRSLSTLLEEITALYQDKPLPNVSWQYRDYVEWQLKQSVEEEKKYWLNQLGGELPKLDLPTDLPRSAKNSTEGALHHFHFDKELTQNIKSFTSKEGVTLYIFLMAIYQVLLFRYTKQQDIIIGSSVEGRPLPELKKMIGACINTVPLRAYPTPSKSFHTFLNEIKATCLASLQNQRLPFDQLVDSLSLSRENPLFETHFDLHQDRHLSYELEGLHLNLLPFNQDSTKFPLALEAIDKGEAIHLHFEYASALFSKTSMEKMATHFEALIREVIQDPQMALSSIEMLTKEERHELLFVLNNSSKPVSPLFLELFAEQVKKRPDAIAAIYENEQITYAELDKRSTHLAHHLAHYGLKEETCTAFYMERSLHFLISMLAVFKTGAAYLPLDLNAPLERIQVLIEESRCLFIMSDRLLDQVDCPVYNVPHLLGSEIQTLSLPAIHQRNIAYIIFTSGSTGRPKGAMIEHEGMVNHLWTKVEDMELDESSVIAQTSSQTFDVSVWQFLVALMVGGTTVVFSDEKAWDPKTLLSSLHREKITVFETVPSHMNLVMEEVERESHAYPLPNLRWLILNGEALLSPLCLFWQRYYPNIPILNAYGPTECSDDVCHHKIFSPLPANEMQIPIGKILRNLGAYILDSGFSLLPFGVSGDLYIEGVGLGRGYLHAPEKTASSFIPFAFDLPGKSSKRMYRTGDIARYRADGCIEYLGRADHQIKIRGQRVELGEIEAVLNQEESVLQAVVEAKVLEGADKSLIAYLVLKSGYSSEEILSSIQENIKERLPYYMVPSYFVLLPSFPLLVNGKVDRKSLPLPHIDKSISKTEYREPRNEIEKTLALFWSELLKVERVGIDQNFFELGGHSLLATQLMARILRTFDVKLPLRSLFESPTLAGLSPLIEAAISNKKESIRDQLPEIVPSQINRDEEFPLTDVQQAYWIGRSGFYSLGEVSVHVYSEYDCPQIDLVRLERAWNQIINRHEALRLVLTPQGTQKILETVPYYAIETIETSEEQSPAALAALRNKHSHEVFNAEVWPLFSIRAVKYADKLRLFLSFDALILDGWSVDLVFSEWVRLYDNPSLQLRPLEVSFRDYVLSMKELKNSLLYAEDRAYWVNRLDNFPLAPALPLVKSTKEIEEQKFSRASRRFEAKKWKALQQLLHDKKLSPTGLLSALFAEILHLYSGSNHFAINLTLFDRLPLHKEINEIAGDFTSLTLLEADHRQLPCSFLSRAQQLQQQLWQDLDHKLFSGIEFIRELGRKRPHLETGMLFPVVFTSVIGLDNQQNDDLLRLFGQEAFSITQTPQVWLDYKAYEINGDLVIEWDYVTELFAPGFVDAMHASYYQLLQLLLEDTRSWDQNSFNLLPEKQKADRLEYNNTRWPLTDLLLHDLFHEKAKEQADKPAIITPHYRMSYGELCKIANQLGHHLLSLGACPNQLIAVVMEKGWEQVAGCLAILNSGAAYLPIDPTLPPSRIEELLKIGEVSHILTQSKFAHTLPSSLPAICVDNRTIYASYPSSRPKTLQTKEDLAYVIFTSGSTGVPKGVMIDHRAVVNTLVDLNDQYELTSKDRVLALSNLNFDLSVYDIFGLLSSGGAIVFPEPSRVKDPAHWMDLLIREGVTIWNTVPMFMQMLVESHLANKELLNSALRLVLLSGDWIPVDLPHKIFSLFPPSVRLIGLGGATEASIWSIGHEIFRSESFFKSVPYGKPLRNQTFYVLNDFMEICPEGVIGALYIGGVGLSKGYYRDPTKTKDSFINHPHLGRLYKTGDIGRYLPTNEIEFLGRTDFQVKVNGYRVELQEIEAHLSTHPDVSQTVVNAQNNHLIAYVVPQGVTEEFEIKDPQEILAFKLAQKGVRKTSTSSISLPAKEKNEALYFSRKSYRQFENQKVDIRDIEEWIKDAFRESPTASRDSLSLEKLSSILEVFSPFPSQPLPKYRYASAGSLYPVQIYLEIGSDAIKGVEGGIYYYHPLRHQLNLLQNTSLSHSQVFLSFVAKLDAIGPVYGSLASDFCYLEAGYMLELLKNRMPVSFIHMPLERDQLILDCNNKTSRFPKLYLYLKEENRWLIYKEDALEPVNENEKLSLLPVAEDNYAILQDASFALLFVEDANAGDRNEQLIKAGYLSQRLMDAATELNMGLCPIGTLDERALGQVEKAIGSQNVLHTLFGGTISSAQLSAKEISQEKRGAFQIVLLHYLDQRLPQYMVPSNYVVMQKIPLSVNGKVDRQALPRIEERKEREQIAPQNAWEHSLLKIWADVLKLPPETLSIHDSFYEVGGNSLMLIQVHNQLISTLHLTIGIDKLFQFPTIHTLARHLSSCSSSDLDAQQLMEQAQKQRLSRLNKRRRGQENE